MVVRFVVVAVKQHQVTLRQQRVQHHFVRGRRPVQHEVGFVGVEHFRCMLLRCTGRAFVDQQIP